jgi:hypothetical protein
MASGTNTDLNVASGRPCTIRGATSANDRGLRVIRVNLSLHGSKKLEDEITTDFGQRKAK